MAWGATGFLSFQKGDRLSQNSFPENPIIYPNPTDGKVTVDLKSSYKDISVKLNDIQGRQLFAKFYDEERELHFKINEPSGVYFLTIVTENKRLVFKLVKN